MSPEDAEFQKQLLESFRVEARERLTGLSSGLVELEQVRNGERRAQLLETLVRDAHSLKGAARAVDLPPVVAVARGMEVALTALKREELAAAPELFDALHSAVDCTGRYLEASQKGSAAPELTALEKSVRALEQICAGCGKRNEPTPAVPPAETVAPAPDPTPEEIPVSPEPEAPAKSFSESSGASSETVRIASARLGGLLLETEQFLSTKLAWEHYVAELKAVNRDMSDWEKSLRKTYSARRTKTHGKSGVETLLETEYQRIRPLKSKLTTLEKSAEQNRHAFDIAVTNLLEDMKSILMLPFSTLLGPFPKMVRDLARDRGKEVDLTIEGAGIEIDKRILDEIKDPLIHLIRNCIDHGIESPEERERKGKTRRGRLTLSVAQKDAGKVEIVFADDGAGMNAGKIRSAAAKLGILSANEAKTLSDREVQALVFRSGVTTSPIVTDISGRGLGLAIVQEKVVKLNGALGFESHPDQGTTFRLVLPLTLATFRGVVIQCGEHPFIVPTANVEQVLRIDRSGIKTVEHCKTLRIRDEIVSLVKLADVLELPAKASTESSKAQIAVIGAGGRQIAFEVDGIVREQEVLVKPLAKPLVRIRNIGGATILGTGQVVPILNVQDLLASAVKWAAAGTARPVAEKAVEVTKSLLVVEDSITTRTLLKNILEAAGYDVWTAVDGVDALTRLRERTFDLVVSDVMMPRMNGFELTARIRADKHLAETPVVLVTAQESREDQERGIDVGANAYIIKSSFDQSNLLETIGRLT